jgi:hypothetical protein
LYRYAEEPINAKEGLTREGAFDNMQAMLANRNRAKNDSPPETEDLAEDPINAQEGLSREGAFDNMQALLANRWGCTN